MHVRIISIGKLKKGPERALVDDYVDRFNKAGPNIGLRSLSLVDLASGGSLDAEGERLLGAIPEGALVFRLDEHGKALSSVDFANKMAKLRDEGVS